MLKSRRLIEFENLINLRILKLIEKLGIRIKMKVYIRVINLGRVFNNQENEHLGLGETTKSSAKSTRSAQTTSQTKNRVVHQKVRRETGNEVVCTLKFHKRLPINCL